MRILIIGAGIAGLTLAALLRQRGFSPCLIDRAAALDGGGYALGLYPLGGRVLHGLGLHGAFMRQSVPYDACDVCDGHGRVVRRFEVSTMFASLGSMRGMSRAALTRVIADGVRGLDLRLSISVEHCEQDGDIVRVRTSDGQSSEWDLVVGADGINSSTRGWVSPHTGRYDSGWACWTWWTRPEALAPGELVECWGAGRVLGLYPTSEGVCVVACAPARRWAGARAEGRAERIRALFPAMQGPGAAVVAAPPADGEAAFYWRLDDRRASRWTHGRVTLLGDAACAFLPTAGIGASMALESAAVLAEELARTDAVHVAAALRFYEMRRRPRCEAAQNDSRRLSRLMFIENRALDVPRRMLMRVARAKDIVRQIFQLAERPI